jgi:hypothetical protein
MDLPNATSLLPDAILHLNLFRAFLWYIGVLFAVSIVLRIRFYIAISALNRHVQNNCPSIYRLIQEHSYELIRNGIIIWVSAYLWLLIPSYLLNNFVWPKATIDIVTISSWSPMLLVVHLVFIGLMLTIDFVLTIQVSAIDTERIVNELNASESWLSGEFNRILSYLGSWNPIKIYADAKTKECITWLNGVLCQSLASMMVQLGVRLLVVCSLYASHLIIDGTPH